ncbi:MAG TPA: class I SAM-dependent methyltransferase [Dehalococcoidia bacterium]|nr:class I SAM-dependent methyltransferase [Dehalococcoidia bacterium]
MGTGDGRFVLATAAGCSDILVIGVDANAASMAEASRRAAKSTRRGGLPNALFVVAAAESLPHDLDGLADAVTIHFPWGSLLRGLLSADVALLQALARVTRSGAAVTVLLSVTPRDNLDGLESIGERTFGRLAGDYATQGLTLVGARPAEADDLARSHSTWAKRLGARAGRPAWLVRFRRDARNECSSFR